MADAFPSITPHDLIVQALKAVGVLGVGQSPAAEDMNDGLFQLNLMLGEWNSKRWLMWHLLDLFCVSIADTTVYTIGPSADFVIQVRPDKIEAAFVRQITQPIPNQPDYILDILKAREDFALIAMKSQTSMPSYLFYDPIWPTGELHFWPVPLPDIYELHVLVKDVLTGFSDLTKAFKFPPDYYSALFHNLVVRLCPLYQRPAPQESVALAKAGLNTIRQGNTQIGRLRMPGTLVRPGIYNPYSDRVR